jgi:general secretion pathway protein A
LCTATSEPGTKKHMYEEFFRLQRKPFRANPKGAEVFVGPQTARFVTSMKTALVGSDAVVAITGPAGIGKSALVSRALDTLSKDLRAVRMPRARLGHDEVLDFLLAELDVAEAPVSTIRKVLLCRELLARLSRSGHGLCIVVEDAERIGEDALVEIEALTAADSHGDQGARVVILGSESLRDMLKTPALSRLAQRTRLRFKVEPLNAGELLAYLKHAFRLAGAEYEQLFADDVAVSLHELCGGVPRLVNNLVDTVLATAAEQRRSRVDARLLAQVAKEQFGLERSLPAPPPEVRSGGQDAREADVRKAAPPAPLPTRPAHAPAAGKAEPRFVEDTLPDLEQLAPELANLPPSDDDSREIPTLFSSTRMEAPTPAAAVAQKPPPKPAPQRQQSAPSKTTVHPAAQTPAAAQPAISAPPLSVRPAPGVSVPPAPVPPAFVPSAPVPPAAETPAVPPTAISPKRATAAVVPAAVAPVKATPQPEAARPLAAMQAPATPVNEGDPPVVQDDIPAWDKDPTLAELRPDIEALELAMAEFSREEPVRPAVTEDDDPVIELKNATFAGVPEITLDIAIQQKIAEATDALKKQEQTFGKEGFAAVPAPAKATPEKGRKKAATSVSSAEAARSEDLRKVAEGIARAKSLEDVDDKMAETLFGEEFSAIAAAVAANAPSHDETEPDGVNDDASVQATMEREFREVYGADAVEVSLQGDLPRGGLDLSASQRLATVRALNAERQLSESARIRAAAAKAGAAAANRVVPSQSIEEQITTSLTQTLRTLTVRPANDDDDDDDDDRKGGFFSRFRRH